MKWRPSCKSVNWLFVVLMIISAVLLLYSLLYTYKVTSSKSAEEVKIEKYYGLCDDFEAASELFTDEARQFVIDYDLNRVQKYWEEAYTTETVERCVKEIEESGDFSDTEVLSLRNAANTLSEIRENEAQAMLLVAAACNYDESALPEPLGKYKLSASQKAMSAEDKIYSARLLLYGENYSTAKEYINLNLGSFRGTVDLRYKTEKQKSMNLLNIAVTFQIAVLSVMLVLTVALFVMYRRLCLVPLMKNGQKADVSGNIPLEETGFAELETIAKRYNEKINEKSEVK